MTPQPPYVVRTLGREEWPRLAEVYGAVPPYDPTFTLAVVVEDAAGVLVAAWMACNTVHLEGLTIAPDARQLPTVATKLLAGMFEALREAGIPGALTLVRDPLIAGMAERVGFTPLEGQVWQIALAPTAEEAAS